jgi:hypothetical protein
VLGGASCGVAPRNACHHGTFILGMLAAREDALVPGLCPECEFLHIPIFVDGDAPSTDSAQLAQAIVSAVRRGAHLINLSLALCQESKQDHPQLLKALEEAQAAGAVVVAAAGNQGQLAVGPILSHPATIPVVAVDANRDVLPECNFGPAIVQRGVAAFGLNVRGYGADGKITTMSGTSVATAVATGVIAEVWRSHPNSDGAAIRNAVARLATRDGGVPPIVERNSLSAALKQENSALIAVADRDRNNKAAYWNLRGEATMMNESSLIRPHNRNIGPAIPARADAVRPAHVVTGCSCGGTGGACTCAEGGASNFVYVLGTVDIRFPDQSISYELQRLGDSIGVVQGKPTSEREVAPDEDVRSWSYRLLSHPKAREARYIARQLAWVLTVEGVVGYYLRLADPRELDDLISCLGQPSLRGGSPRRPDDAARAGWHDLSLFVGSSSLLPVEICPGIEVPILSVDYLYSYKWNELTSWFKPINPEALDPGGQGADEDDFLAQLLQSTDNFGDRDEWRALNYLATQCSDLYRQYADRLRKGYFFDSVSVASSALERGTGRRIVKPIFSFRNKEGDIKSLFARVDVTHLFPMLVSPVSPYVAKVIIGG